MNFMLQPAPTRMASVAPHLNTTADEMSWNIYLHSYKAYFILFFYSSKLDYIKVLKFKKKSLIV